MTDNLLIVEQVSSYCTQKGVLYMCLSGLKHNHIWCV